MEKRKVLEKILNMDYTQLVPSSTFKSELFLLTNEEFNELYEHMKYSKTGIKDGYDTIIIGNRIFKKTN